MRCLLAASADVKVEEAYYWCYARHLAPGYFDHPPMVAWLIALFQPLGTHPLAVRLPAILLFAGSGWLLYLTLRRWFEDARTAEIGLWLHTLLPAFHWYSLLMLPDAPLMFFWTLGMYASTRLVQDENPNWWWLIGVATGLGLDSKYPALLIPLGTFLYCWTSGKDRRLWWCFPMIGSALLALILFSPVIYWNWTHDFASFRFQGAERFAESNDAKLRAASFIYPAVMLGPCLYLALPLVLWWAIRRSEQPAMRFALAWTLPFLILIVYVGSQRLVNINWPIPAYLGLLLLFSAWIREQRARFVLVIPSAIASLLPMIALVVPLAVANRGDDITTWAPMAKMALQKRQEMPDPERTFFLGHGYQSASELAFHGIPLDLLVSVNALGQRGLGFDYWTPPARFTGWDAIIVAYARVKANGQWAEIDVPELPGYFGRLSEPEELIVQRAGAPLRRYLYWRGYDYKGPDAH